MKSYFSILTTQIILFSKHIAAKKFMRRLFMSLVLLPSTSYELLVLIRFLFSYLLLNYICFTSSSDDIKAMKST